MLRVGFDAAALVLNRAGEYRYASALRGALRGREDVELHELWPGRRVPRTLPARIALQAAVQGVWYPFAVPRAARRARLDVLLLSAPELFSAPIRANFRALAGPLARRAAVVLTGSQASARDIAEHLRVPAERIVVTPYGVEPRFRPAPASQELLARLGIDRP